MAQSFLDLLSASLMVKLPEAVASQRKVEEESKQLHRKMLLTYKEGQMFAQAIIM